VLRITVQVILVAVLCSTGMSAGSVLAEEQPLGCSAKLEAPADNFSEPPNYDLALPLLRQKLIFYRCTRYEADIARVLGEALAWVKYRAPQTASPAIVLDIDDTSLSNWTRIYRDKFDYIAEGPCDLTDNTQPCGDALWQRGEKAPAIGPTLALYRFARCIEIAGPCKPIEVFFITGRKENATAINDKTPRQWTLENLIAAGYADAADDHLFLRSGSDKGVADYKSSRRALIENGLHLRIIANIGDQESDLIGGYAERPFKVPNPFYYIPK